MRKILAFLFLLCACCVALPTYAMGTFSITRENNYFVIHRSDTSFAQTVNFRAVSRSALVGQHFDAQTGEVTFAKGQDTVHVRVTEKGSTSVPLAYRYQSTTSRSYAFEVTDVNGYLLASQDWNISYNTKYQFQNEYTSQSITDLIYFGAKGMTTGMSYGKYYDVDYNEGHVYTITDAGYSQGVYNISTSTFFAAIPASQDYLNEAGYKLYATVYFYQAEKEDGYQYIQILADNSTTCDGNDVPSSGATETDYKTVYDPSVSLYKASFELSYSGIETNYKTQFFPHRYNYEKNDDNPNERKEFATDNARLYQQKFKNDSYKSTTSGSLVLSPTVNTVNVRFDAAGKDKDDWYVRDLKLRLALCDATAPTIKKADVAVSAGPYAPGQTVYISVPCTEIVNVTGNPTLTTSWGDFNYVSGSGTNVLAFIGTVPSGNTPLSMTAISEGTITDMAGNNLNRVVNTNTAITPLSLYTLNASNTFIDVVDTVRDNGGAQTPTPTVTYYTGTEAHTLTAGTDYEVSYSDNDVPGTATVTITGIGNYYGSVSNNFTIRGVNLSDFSKSGSYYLVSSKEDLELLSLLVNRNNSEQNSSIWFKQTADIDFNGGALQPIGNSSHPFKAQYLGEGHTISHLNITAAQDELHTGLFGNMSSSAQVKNLRLDSCTIAGNKFVGAIAGDCKGTIQNCRVESTVTVRPANSQERYECFGGIAGRLSYTNASISGCYCAAVVTNNGKPNNCLNFGGIVGSTFSSSSCYVRDNIYAGSTIEANENVGAIIGLNTSDKTQLTNNYYLNDNLPGGIDSVDVSGASRARTITFDEYVSLSGSSTVYDLSGIRAYTFALLTDTAAYTYEGSTINLGLQKSRPYYDFVHYVYNDGEDHIIEGNSFAMPATDVTGFATWTPTVYTISYNLIDGELPEGQSNPDTYTIESADITLVNPERPNFDFIGWTGTGLNGSAMEVTIPTGSHGDREYSAAWQSKTYTISYDLDGGVFPNPSIVCNNYNIYYYTITLQNPERAHSVFVGWTGTDLDEPTMEVTIPTGSQGDRSYTAHYTQLVEADDGYKYYLINDQYFVNVYDDFDNYNDGNYDEAYNKIMDGLYTTKWCVVQKIGSSYGPCSIEFQLNEAKTIMGYELTTGNDVENNPNRNPSAWSLFAKLNWADDWTLIDSRDVTQNQKDALPDSNMVSVVYPIDPSKVDNYQYFQFVIERITDIEATADRPIMEIGGLDLLTYAPDSIYARAAREANCELPGNSAYWYRNGNYYSDEACNTQITKADLYQKYQPPVTHHNSQPATLTQDGHIEYWETECGTYRDEACTEPVNVEFDEGGHYDDVNKFYWVRMVPNNARTVLLDNTINSFHVYDDGGAVGDYSNNIDYSVLLLTAPENYTLRIEGTVCKEYRCDELTIYDGTTYEDGILVDVPDTHDGDPMTIDPIETTGRNALLYFYSDASNRYAGFDLLVTLVPPSGEPTDIDHVQRDNVPCTKIIRDGQLLIERNGRTYTITGQPID